MKSRMRFPALFASLLALFGCAAQPDLPPLRTVAHVDLQRYAGTWYEIARYHQRFQKGCVASQAVYTLRDDGLIGVRNSCRTEDGGERTASGVARVIDATSNARLEVSFFRPFWGDYWIIDLDADYRWAVVGHPSRKYLWLLARDTRLDEGVLSGILSRLEGQGYDTAPLIWRR